jgi:hypothetical protein
MVRYQRTHPPQKALAGPVATFVIMNRYKEITDGDYYYT